MVLQRKRERERERTSETNKKNRERQRKRKRERERLSINLCAYPYTLRNQGGAEILSISYFSSSSDFRLPPSKIRNWGANSKEKLNARTGCIRGEIHVGACSAKSQRGCKCTIWVDHGPRVFVPTKFMLQQPEKICNLSGSPWPPNGSKPEDKRCMSFRMMWCLACELLVLELGKPNVRDLHANTTCMSLKVTNGDIMLCSAEGGLP